MNILVTGGAGFIGSNLTLALLADNRITKVRVLDNLSTGYLENLKEVMAHPKMEWMEGDIRDMDTCLKACSGIDIVSHQAALGSVPRSIQDPMTTNAVNVGGTLNMFHAAVQQGVKRVVYAGSSSTYGDNPILPKVEERIGNPLSPYAVSKYAIELYAKVFKDIYNLDTIGFRYFNVFGPRQNVAGPYAAVIPVFITHLLKNEAPFINGDGSNSRDFTYVGNVVQANIKALFTENQEALNQVYNIACGDQTTIAEMYAMLEEISGRSLPIQHRQERVGDVLHSLADTHKAERLLGYSPEVTIQEGLELTWDWFKSHKPS
jgi:UDP-N-acetylglucosamine 4-epimerase